MEHETDQNAQTWKFVLAGCGISFLVMFLLCGGLAYYAYLKTEELVDAGKEFLIQEGTELVQTSLTSVIDESLLPDEQKAAMKVQIDRVADGFKSGKITFEQLGEILENLNETPAFTAIPVEVVRYAYLEPSGLTDEEKADATKHMQRVMHGLFEKQINEDEFDGVMDTIADKNPNDDTWEFKEKVTDEELRAFVTECKTLADEKEIPDENFEVDLAKELKEAIDEVLLGTPKELVEEELVE